MKPSSCWQIAVNRYDVQGLFHGRVRVTEELLKQEDAKHHHSYKGRTYRLASRYVVCNQGQQLQPRNDQVNLVQKLTPARALADKLETGGGKTDFIHLNLMPEAFNWVIFADHTVTYINVQPPRGDRKTNSKSMTGFRYIANNAIFELIHIILLKLLKI